MNLDLLAGGAVPFRPTNQLDHALVLEARPSCEQIVVGEVAEGGEGGLTDVLVTKRKIS